MLPLIDTHQHLWDLTHLELPWTGGIPQLNKNFVMSDYLKASEGQNVSKTVYMEVDAHHHHRQREVEFINEICSDDSNPIKAAVFGADPGGARPGSLHQQQPKQSLDPGTTQGPS